MAHYTKIDPKKAEELAIAAFTATQALEDPANDDRCGPVGSAGDIKSWIQGQVLRGLMAHSEVTKAEELLPMASIPVRRDVTGNS